VLRHDGTVETLENMGGLVLGVFSRAQFTSATVTLRRGDELLLYSDGVTEAMDYQMQPFTVSRLDDELRAASRETPEATVQHVLSAVHTHAGAARQHDDITALCIRYDG
jgi:sigma-B regulation protein RsbU (phosphoserine phosphatase)